MVFTDLKLDWQVYQAVSFTYNRYVIVASITVLILEYFHFLEEEKRLIWPSKWKLPKFLFMIGRYLPFGVLTIYLYYNAGPPSTSAKDCHILLGFEAVGTMISSLCADAVLYVRLHAISKQARHTKYILIANFTAVTIIGLIAAVLFATSVTFIPNPKVLPPTSNCVYVPGEKTIFWLTICFVVPLYSSIFTISLLLWYGIKLYRALRPLPPSDLIKMFHRDGAVYFVCIATISLVNVLSALIPTIYFRYILSSAQAMFHGVLATRLILHLRMVAQADILESKGTFAANLPMDFRKHPASSGFMLSDFAAATHPSKHGIGSGL